MKYFNRFIVLLVCLIFSSSIINSVYSMDDLSRKRNFLEEPEGESNILKKRRRNIRHNKQKLSYLRLKSKFESKIQKQRIFKNIYKLDEYSDNTKLISDDLDNFYSRYSKLDLELDKEIKKKNNGEYSNIVSKVINLLDFLEISFAELVIWKNQSILNMDFKEKYFCSYKFSLRNSIKNLLKKTILTNDVSLVSLFFFKLNYFIKSEFNEIFAVKDSNNLIYFALQKVVNEEEESLLNFRIVKMLMEEGVPVDWIIYDETSLMLAIRKKASFKVVSCLLTGNINIHYKSKCDSADALFIALAEAVDNLNREKVIGALVNSGANINSTYSEQELSFVSPVEVAIDIRDSFALELFLRKGAKINKSEVKFMFKKDFIDDYNFKLVVDYCDEVSIIKYLLKKTKKKNIKILKFLLDKAKHKLFPIHYALRNLIKDKVDFDLTFDPWKNIVLMLEEGMDINKKDFMGRTPLHFYISESDESDLDVVKFFIEKGASVNNVEISGTDLLSVALRQNVDDDIIKLLIKSGADAKRLDEKNGLNCLYFAIDSGYSFEIIKLLLDKGADANIEFSSEVYMTPLLMALDFNFDKNIIELLVENGANVNAICKEENFSAAHFCIIHNNLEVLKYLVGEGLNLFTQDMYGQTLLDFAKEHLVEGCGILKFLEDSINQSKK